MSETQFTRETLDALREQATWMAVDMDQTEGEQFEATVHALIDHVEASVPIATLRQWALDEQALAVPKIEDSKLRQTQRERWDARWGMAQDLIVRCDEGWES